MSTNEIDVNAVNKKNSVRDEECASILDAGCETIYTPDPVGTTEEVVVAKNTGKKNEAWSVDDEHLRQLSNFIKFSVKGRWLYRKMMTLMFFESIAWTILDALRAARMRTAEKLSQSKLKK